MKYEAIKKYRKTKKGVLINIYDHIKRRNKDKFGLELDFTSKDFKDKYIDDENFLNAYNSWVESGYKYYKKPSADRINPDKPYTFENMQFMTWEENRRKGEKERSRITTSVCMFDLSGKHIKDFESIKEAVKETGLNQSGITSCCCGRYKQTGGYVFRYKYSCYKKTKQVIGNTQQSRTFGGGRMSEYKRLTKWEMNKGVKCVKYWQYSQEQIAERLALLEDKIENGTLIELPCKVGDTVWSWLIRDCYDEWTVDKINIYVENGRLDYTLVCTSKSGCGMDYFYKDDKDIDWTFNNPKAEAEARLKELQEKQK